MVQEKKGMMKVWNMLLVVLAFCLSLFGTFLTRSGIINSIHSFTQSSIGPWFLGLICLITAGSLSLVYYRLPLLRAKTKLESVVSREATFLYNNLLLVALCLTILWGVCYPLVTEAVRGQSVTVGRPYYDFFLRVFGLPLLLLMGIGPLIAWRRTSVRALARAVAWPLGGAVVAGLALVAAGAGSSKPGLIAYTFSAFVLGTIAVELVRGTRAVGSLFVLVSRNRRRYGGYIVHASVVLLAIGVAGSSAYGSTTERKLVVGQSMHVPGYTLMLRGLTVRNTSNATETRAVLGVNGRWRGTISSGANQYRNPPEPSNEVGIKTNWLRGEDLYVIASGFNQKQHAVYVKVLVKPLVNLIWIAGIVFLLGSAVAIWPDAREQRRLVTRLAPARA
jgi:cytochrome c-type biogenesis protein CcmF